MRHRLLTKFIWLYCVSLSTWGLFCSFQDILCINDDFTSKQMAINNSTLFFTNPLLTV